MTIYNMTATFGKLEHATLSLQPGLNVIHAPNEWGKSTWCAFLSAMFYGIETRVHTTKTTLADKERYQPWSGKPMSGRIDLCWNGKDITIERQSKGRGCLNQFRAYETHSGLPVEELTADNCGQMLLGVEKSVFLRSGFLRLNDLPVTEDDALRRRLNSLVTTGDERDTAELLGQKLRELKNRCRANRSTGLIPQLEQQQLELENKLQQLRLLKQQWETLRQQQDSLQESCQQLENHRQAMAYRASQLVGTKLASARNTLGQAQLRCRQLEEECRQDPAEELLPQQLEQLRLLQQHWESLQFEAQMLPLPPEAPQAPKAFQGMTQEQIRQQVTQDTARYKKAAKKRKQPILAILAVVFALLGIAGVILTKGLLQWAGAAGLLAGAGCLIGFLATRLRAGKALRQLAKRYDAATPEQWKAGADAWLAALEAHNRQLRHYQQQQVQLGQRKAQLEAQIREMTGGETLQSRTEQWQQAAQRRQALLDARRAFQQAKELVQTLEQAHRLATPPDMEDTLELTEAETQQQLIQNRAALHGLQEKLGHTQGLAEALGSEAELSGQLQAVKERIGRLEDVYAAVQIAQDTLQQASAALQQRFAPKISQRARALFSELTDGRYDRLTLTRDLTLEAGAAGEDTLHSALWRSEGTADQLYFCLRLAVAEALIPNTPLILDDALARFDETRLRRALAILRQTAELHQVILFTCHKREEAILADHI